MAEYGFVRCLFCKTGKEESIVRLIHEKGWGRVLFPQRIKTVMRDGAWTEVLFPLLPGYVFVYQSPGDGKNRDFWGLPYVIRVLAYDDGSDVLFGRDLEFADWIWRQDGRIGPMKAAQINDRIEITDGAFKNLRGTVTRMDKRRKTVRVALETLGAPKQIWLAYEIVERIDGPAGPRES
ncbi:MAG: transcription termination/antitermination NusG family protein [Aristaeellaceae bacterium]